MNSTDAPDHTESDDPRSLNNRPAANPEKGERTTDPYDNGWLATQYSRVSFGLLIVAAVCLIFSIPFGEAGTLPDILTRATGFSWSFLDGGISGGLALSTVVLACLSLHQKKTRAGIVLLVAGLVVFVIQLVLTLL